jgi:hypothetical protein
VPLLSLLNVPVVLAQTPSYISSLSPYQVRNLTGTYAPMNGEATIASVTPSEWLTSDPVGSLIGVILAWSGGPKPLAGSKLFVHGGGHQDSANNGLYAFDFSGTTAPTGWTLPAISTVAAVQVGAAYSDGKPSASHTYDGMVYGTNGYIYRFGGGLYFNAGFRSDAWKFNVATSGPWVRLADVPEGSGLVSPMTLYDPSSQKILITVGGATSGPFEYRIFRLADDSYSAVKTWPSGNVIDDNKCGAYDTSRNRGLLIGQSQPQLITIDWITEAANIASQTLPGLPQITGPSCFYDGGRDVYWVFGGETSSSGWTTIYEINASTFAVTGHSLMGDSITPAAGMVGSYGRFVFLANWRAIGVVADINTPVSVVRLPDPLSPAAPTNLTVAP